MDEHDAGLFVCTGGATSRCRGFRRQASTAQDRSVDIERLVELRGEVYSTLGDAVARATAFDADLWRDAKGLAAGTARTLTNAARALLPAPGGRGFVSGQWN